MSIFRECKACVDKLLKSGQEDELQQRGNTTVLYKGKVRITVVGSNKSSAHRHFNTRQYNKYVVPLVRGLDGYSNA